MNVTLAQESPRIDKNLCKIWTPVRRKTFSENMTRRRHPFLTAGNEENNNNLRRKSSYENETTIRNFKSPGKSDVPNKYRKIKSPLGCKCNELNIQSNGNKTNKTKNKRQGRQEDSNTCGTHENETHESETQSSKFGISNWCDSAQTSGYNTDSFLTETSSIVESETSFSEISKEHMKPLQNSTFADEFFTYEETHNSKYPGHPTKPHTPSHLHKFEIPLIVINEIEIIDNRSIESKTLAKPVETLKVPAILKKTNFEENKELQNKLIEMELFKHTAVKDKVMIELLDLARSMDFPHLKHFCNIMCEKTDDGECKKTVMEREKKAKAEEECGGFFQSLWSVFINPFAGNSKKLMEEVKTSKDNVVKDNKDKVDEKVQNDKDTKEESKESDKNKLDKENEKFLESKEDEGTITTETKNSDIKEKSEGEMEVTKKQQIKLSQIVTNEITTTLEEKNAADNKVKQEVPKKSKSKKSFFSFFKSKKKESKNTTVTPVEAAAEDTNKIESMEDIFEELGKKELQISEEALKKLENFMHQKSKETKDVEKKKGKRSGSF